MRTLEDLGYLMLIVGIILGVIVVLSIAVDNFLPIINWIGWIFGGYSSLSLRGQYGVLAFIMVCVGLLLSSIGQWGKP